jgi:methylglyoxal/glyoxal reductase
MKMARHLSDYTILSNGVKMPWFGLGVYKTADGPEVENAVKWAIEAGYRSIDTASLYGNEAGVGKAIKESGVSREEIFVTTKVWNTDQGYESTLRAFEESRSKLDLEYVDLYLIHWPGKDKYKDTWKALEKLYKEGKARAIGVSNFHVHHLQNLMADSEMKPMVNQVEYHPYLTQKELHQFCKEQGIQFEAWSPLGRGRILTNPVIVKLGEKYEKTPAQIILRWDLQNGVVTIPKSVHKERIIDNANLFDFELSTEDMQAIDGLNRNERFGQDPDKLDF